MAFETKPKSNFEVEVKLSDRTKDAIIAGEVDKADVDKVVAKANELIETLKDNKCARNAMVDVNSFTTKEGEQAVSRSISFSAKEAGAEKDDPSQKISFSINKDNEVTKAKVTQYDVSTSRNISVPVSEANSRIQSIYKALESQVKFKEVPPAKATVNKFIDAVMKANETEKTADGKGEYTYKLNEFDSKADGHISQISVANHDSEVIQIDVKADGSVKSGTYMDYKGFDGETHEFAEDCKVFSSNLNYLASGAGSLGEVVKSGLDAIGYEPPKKVHEEIETKQDEEIEQPEDDMER